MLYSGIVEHLEANQINTRYHAMMALHVLLSLAAQLATKLDMRDIEYVADVLEIFEYTQNTAEKVDAHDLH